MTRVITVLNQKGGVGKSTATVNLAAIRAQTLTAHLDPDAFSPVAAVSIDPQGSAKWWANRVGDLPFHLVQAHDDPLEWLRQLNNLPGIDRGLCRHRGLVRSGPRLLARRSRRRLLCRRAADGAGRHRRGDRAGTDRADVL